MASDWQNGQFGVETIESAGQVFTGKHETPVFQIRAARRVGAQQSLRADHGEYALAVSDEVIVMDRGRIAQQGTPSRLYEAPASRFLADFIGDANLVSGELLRTADGTFFCAASLRALVRGDGLAAGPATLAVRPHRLRLTPAGEGLLPAECLRMAYLGSRIEYVLGTPWGELLVFDGGVHAPLARGAQAGVSFEPDDAIVLPGAT
jgi:iron(III) transport system ATP-binding protein